jgi:hypothetical protein
MFFRLRCQQCIGVLLLSKIALTAPQNQCADWLWFQFPPLETLGFIKFLGRTLARPSGARSPPATRPREGTRWPSSGLGSVTCRIIANSRVHTSPRPRGRRSPRQRFDHPGRARWRPPAFQRGGAPAGGVGEQHAPCAPVCAGVCAGILGMCAGMCKPMCAALLGMCDACAPYAPITPAPASCDGPTADRTPPS